LPIMALAKASSQCSGGGSDRMGMSLSVMAVF
jgi:hypothetical protein